MVKCYFGFLAVNQQIRSTWCGKTLGCKCLTLLLNLSYFEHRSAFLKTLHFRSHLSFNLIYTLPPPQVFPELGAPQPLLSDGHQWRGGTLWGLWGEQHVRASAGKQCGRLHGRGGLLSLPAAGAEQWLGCRFSQVWGWFRLPQLPEQDAIFNLKRRKG